MASASMHVVFLLSVIVVYVVKGQTIFAPTVSATNNSIILQAGGATVTISGPGSEGATGQTNGVPYSPVVTQAELQAFAAQISPQVYMSHLYICFALFQIISLYI